MMIVVFVGAFGIPVLWAVGISKAHSPKNAYLRERARWPSSRY
jgi:hypothetical protein